MEICISQQKMWCYKDGQLVVETPVVTGSHATGYDTPAGSVWAIDGKKSDYDFTLIRRMLCSGCRLTIRWEFMIPAGGQNTVETFT